MTLSRLDLILCDLYSVDAVMPPMLGKTKKDFKIQSYAKWAINEFEAYIYNNVGTQECVTVENVRELTNEFINRMDTYSKINDRTSMIFQVASIIGNDVLEVLDSMD